MTDRERLIEMLNEWGNKENDGVRAESIADYLLANGVILPPVKVEYAEKTLHKINHNSLCETETYKVDT